MDGRQFDEITRFLASRKTRRQTLKAMLAAVAGTAGIRGKSALAVDETCLGNNVPCAEAAQCCSGSCPEQFCTCVGAGSVCYSVDDCCDGLECKVGAHVSGADACAIPAEPGCAGDDDCEAGLICVDQVCSEPSTCEEGDPGNCVNYDEECCSGYYCVGQQCIAIPVCAPLYCSSIVACCDNKICLTGNSTPPEGTFSGGSCYVKIGELCDANGDQGCQAGECVDGYCGSAPVCAGSGAGCISDVECCGGLVCTEGTCAVEGPVDTGGGGDGAGDGGGENDPGIDTTGGNSEGSYVAPVSLPATGAGAAAGSDNALLKVGLAAGAAVLVAGAALKRETVTSDSGSTD